MNEHVIRVSATLASNAIHHGNEYSKTYTYVSSGLKNKSVDAFEILYDLALPYFQIDSSITYGPISVNFVHAVFPHRVVEASANPSNFFRRWQTSRHNLNGLTAVPVF